MSRFLVQRTFPEGLAISATSSGAKTRPAVVENNAEESVTWITSYVSREDEDVLHLYDGRSRQSIERAAWPTGCPSTRSAKFASSTWYFYQGGKL